MVLICLRFLCFLKRTVCNRTVCRYLSPDGRRPPRNTDKERIDGLYCSRKCHDCFSHGSLGAVRRALTQRGVQCAVSRALHDYRKARESAARIR